MTIIPGRYGGYGVRSPRPGSASRMVDPMPEGWKNTYARAEKALAEPFRGVTTDGQVVPDLFSLQQTGVSTKPVKDAADAFIASLTAAQKQVALHAIDAPEWRKWTNWEQYPLRHGVSLDQMSPSQRQAALALLRESLSVRGFDTARNVMKLNRCWGKSPLTGSSLGNGCISCAFLARPPWTSHGAGNWTATTSTSTTLSSRTRW